MADGPSVHPPESGKARQPLSASRFKATPEFADFKDIMQRLLKVSKSELGEKVKAAKEASPRAGNPKAAGRKKRTDG
jgi:hypothetical protein